MGSRGKMFLAVTLLQGGQEGMRMLSRVKCCDGHFNQRTLCVLLRIDLRVWGSKEEKR